MLRAALDNLVAHTDALVLSGLTATSSSVGLAQRILNAISLVTMLVAVVFCILLIRAQGAARTLAEKREAGRPSPSRRRKRRGT